MVTVKLKVFPKGSAIWGGIVGDITLLQDILDSFDTTYSNWIASDYGDLWTVLHKPKVTRTDNTIASNVFNYWLDKPSIDLSNIPKADYEIGIASGATPTVVTFPSWIDWQNEVTIGANEYYDILILRGKGYIKGHNS